MLIDKFRNLQKEERKEERKEEDDQSHPIPYGRK